FPTGEHRCRSAGTSEQSAAARRTKHPLSELASLAHLPQPARAAGQVPPLGEGGICSCCNASWAMELKTGAAVLPPKWGPLGRGSKIDTEMVRRGFSAGR